MWKDYLSFSKSERITFWTLSVVIILSASLTFAANSWPQASSLEQERINAEIESYFTSLNDSLDTAESKTKSGKKIDLNIASLSELISVGFSKFHASNIVAYRKKGAAFRKVDDVLKIYGMDSISFRKIAANVFVDDKRQSYDTKPTPKHKSSKPNFVIEINSADTAILSFLPGIGPAFSARIVKYRDNIGGFYNLSQLQEVYGFDDNLIAKVLPHLRVDTLLIKPLNINELSIAKMKNHPYLDFYQAKDIYEFRKLHGFINAIDQLFSFSSFKNCDKNLIRRYFFAK